MAGVVISPAIRVAVLDDQGRTLTAAALPITVKLNEGNASLRGTTSRVPVFGVATFDDLIVDKSGTYLFTVSMASADSQTSRSFEVTFGAPSALAFAGDAQTVVFTGTRLAPIAVEVRDAHGNRVMTATNAITLSLTDNAGALRGTRTKSAGGGIASFDDLSIDSPGSNYRLTAISSTLSGDTSGSIKVVQDGGFALKTISVGLDQTCGLDAAGLAYCWGANGFGQLGDGSTADRSSPVAVSGGLRFAMLSAGGGGYEEDVSFTCGVTTTADGYCWGGSFRGGLGDGSTISGHTAPTPISGGLKFMSISAGGAHACGLTVDGDAYCWGSNDYGELGVGDLIGRTTPAAVLGGMKFSTITAGDFHSCATNADGTWCWGGLWGGPVYARSLTPTRVPASPGFTMMMAGTEHTCGLTSAGLADCWGNNASGQLGTGSSSPSPQPVGVSGGRLFSSVSARGYTGCGVSSGKGYCWGWNELGQLGDGFFTPRVDRQPNSPLPVVSAVDFASISAGVWHTCALTTKGTPYCWGFNSNGQLGNDTKLNSAVAVPVAR
ncbi:MAG TPA: hypothetical protein VIV65_09925 [Gemmatimonadaceae bacterium]